MVLRENPQEEIGFVRSAGGNRTLGKSLDGNRTFRRSAGGNRNLGDPLEEVES